MTSRRRTGLRLLAAAPLLLCLAPLLSPPRRTEGQDLGNLLSPGKLSKPHAQLEGLDNCQKCHEPGRKVTAEKCLACHKPVAERIAAKKGVHRDVKGDCVSCHVEHAGVDAELRPFDPKTFDHRAETGFALDGKHAPIAGKCESCHKGRSFLAAQPACASCHADVHKGRLGPDCASCHSAALPFKDAAKTFDHTKAAFALTGAHATVKCAACHKTPDYRVPKFGACNDCHKDPHEKPLGACASCHTTETFKTTRSIAHEKTGFPLVGKHVAVPCATCHVKPPTQVHLKADKCADCHKDPHKGVFKGADCASCHKETGFAGAPFDHAARTGYALDGGHAKVPCASCHKGAAVAAGTPASKASVDFRGAKKDCASCHRDVHKGELGARCETCHTVASFRVASFQHPGNPEFFSAKHAAAPCEKCHTPPGPSPAGGARPDRLFKGVSMACASCHKDPHLGQLGATCQSCHTLQEWKVAAYKHQRKDLAPFFAAKHGTTPCQECHKSAPGTYPAGAGTAIVFKGTSTECASCHKDVHEGTLGTRCESCHKLTGWRNASRAFHKNTIFPLEGRHLNTPCEGCHLRGVLKGTPNRCFDCHWIRKKDDKYETRLGNECGECHRPTSWTAVIWNHGQATGFPLGGAHATLECQTCHRGNVFTGLSKDCYSCHRTDYEGTRNPNHAAAGFPTTCENCHRGTDTSWNQAHFDHGATFPLVGTHAAQPCATCHTNNVYQGTPRDCYGCHRTSYDQTRNPNHASAGFPTTCETCHKATDTGWTGTFNHAATFPLVGLHTSQPCASCHRNNVYRGTPRDCYGCHRAKYEQTRDPNHASAGFPTTCESCHKATDTSWNQSSFNHATTFPLVGVHATQLCATCHRNNVYQGTPRDCYGCHRAKYEQTRDPNHVAAGFPTACETCHKATDTSWNQSSFNHAATFPLVGLHATQACATCHRNNVYRGTPRDCYGCHRTEYDQTRNPNHASAGFPTACESCHKATDTSWNQSSFNHAATFPLVGQHATQSCTSCHRNNIYRGTPRDCYGCHRSDYEQSRNPNHVSAGFPTTCETCHRATDATWNQSTFNHASTFPLLGQHATQACASCHRNNVYRGTPRDCYGCHRAKYEQTRDPNHVAAGFPTTCETCHRGSDASWDQGTFNHASFFPLLGVHATQPCASCHRNNVYRGTPRDCYGCHRTKYEQARDPNHIAAGFPTTCENCHRGTDTAWNQGRFTHAFPIASGRHSGNPCSACHTNPANYAVFTCTTACHPRSETDGHHNGVGGYRYESLACYSCHPQGRAD